MMWGLDLILCSTIGFMHADVNRYTLKDKVIYGSTFDQSICFNLVSEPDIQYPVSTPHSPFFMIKF